MATASVTPLEELRRSPTACLFEGGERIEASVFVTRYERGQGPKLHLHPYPELFVIHTGTAVFTVGEEQLEVAAGHVVVVPAETPHGFECGGDDVLRVTSVHPSPTLRQTDLD
jgi:mannose-6-phosphate isomerase-like protein (cupin superfamily)